MPMGPGTYGTNKKNARDKLKNGKKRRRPASRRTGNMPPQIMAERRKKQRQEAGIEPQKKRPIKKKPSQIKSKPNGKNGLTAKQKTLPKFLQKKIIEKKGKK